MHYPNLSKLTIDAKGAKDDLRTGGPTLTDLPDALLGKVLKGTGVSARELCAAASALSQTDKAARDSTAWEEIAAQYQMPGTPSPSETWRTFVFKWCAKTKRPFDALMLAVLEHDLVGFEWIVDAVYLPRLADPGTPGRHFGPQQTKDVVSRIIEQTRNAEAVSFLSKIWHLLSPDSATFGWIAASAKSKNAALAAWIFDKLLKEVAAAKSVLSKSPVAYPRREAELERKHATIVHVAYFSFPHDETTSVDEYSAYLDALERVAPPSRDAVLQMLDVAARHLRADLMTMLDGRYTYTGNEAANYLEHVATTRQELSEPVLVQLNAWQHRVDDG